MNQLTLRQLRYFDALAKHGHFGHAAEACAISQPALSMQIRELEENLQAPLIERGMRGAQLTPLGEEVARRARQILRSVDDVADLARSAQTGFTGRLRLGVIPTIAPYFLPVALATIAKTHPNLDIHLRETLTHKLIADIKVGELDAAIVALPVSEPSLAEYELFTEQFLLVRPAADRDAPPPSRNDLREMRLLLLEEGHCFRDQALSFCALRTTPRGALDATSLSTLVQMVGAGMGVTLLPEMAAPIETRSANVAISQLEAPQPTRTVGVVWRSASALSHQLKGVAEALRAADRTQ